MLLHENSTIYLIPDYSSIKAVILYCCTDCLNWPANAIQMGQVTQVIWAVIKKYNLNTPNTQVKH